ncbi:very short patch repair endonuclease [Streptomyces tateyamensis]|uniref:Very short patch repair endonuclease n=1 Tax=Streptomyces tateyamensis TaxID=565073 RepID=A0A2V4PAR9_9ACTN|nr:very short patch repair endonuclease [Streptomyces tateyamensis]PYC80597.1 very short patch repair endonuclease [Streptomyces tateyamensis]
MSDSQKTNPAWVAPDGSWASSAANRKSMLGNRSRDTSPELALRSLVHAAGLRYRVAVKPLPKMRRTADLVFRPVRVAVFIDGCFWHGCPDHFVPPKTNPDYWETKIGGNIQRDRDTDARLAAEGWLVLRFWEHQDPKECAVATVTAVSERRKALTDGKAANSARRAKVPLTSSPAHPDSD